MIILRAAHLPHFFSAICSVALLTMTIGCDKKGEIRYSPGFINEQENVPKPQSTNVCASYPLGFSQTPSPEVEALQTPLERRTTALLRQIVTDAGLVKYSNLTSSSILLLELDDLVKSFASQLNDSIPFASQQKAIWINLYNLSTLQLIARNYSGLLGDESSPFPDIKSIQNIQGLGPEIWNIKDTSTALGNLSLNDIEAKIQKTKDPRFHFAINCASVGCPPLLDSAYIGLSLDSQLNERTCLYVNSGKYTIFDNLDPQAPVVFASQIFQWYQADFGNLFEFFSNHLSDNNHKIGETLTLKQVSGENVWSFEFEDYNWELNEEIAP